MASFQKRGPYQWRALIRRTGYPTQSRTFETKDEAIAWARDIESSMDKSIFVDRSKAERTTFNEAIDWHLKNITPRHKGSDSESMRLKRFQREESKLCAYAMANLKPDHFEDYRDRRLKIVKPGTVTRELNLLHAVFKHSARRLALLENPLTEVKRPKVYDERDVRFHDDEEERLMNALSTCRNPYIRPAVVLALETAMRRSELLSLKWNDIDLRNATAKLHDTKNGESREVPLSKNALKTLKELKREQDEDTVVSLDLRVLKTSANSLKHSFQRARARAEMEHFNFHDLRHEAVSRLFERGWEAIKVAAVSGHKDMQSLKRYANFKAKDLAKELG